MCLSGPLAFPQGQLLFDNRVGGVVVAPVYGLAPSDPELGLQGNTAAGTPAGTQVYTGPLLSGPEYSAQLFAGTTNTPVEELQPVAPIVGFRLGTMAGFIAAPDLVVTIPGVPEGVPARAQLRAWFNEGGRFSNWNEARTNGWVPRGVSAPFITRPLGRATILPPNLDGLRSFNLSLPPGVAGQLPPAPTGLQAAAASDTAIDLSWQLMTSPVQGFRIEHSIDGIAYAAASVLASNASNFRVQNLKAGIRHQFRIRAINAVGESPPSNVAAAFTRAPFEQWRLTRFNPQTATNDMVSGPAADPDQDGLSNYGEYAFATDPHTSDREGLITTFIDYSLHPQGVLAAGYSRSRQAAGAGIRGRTSDNFDSLKDSTSVIAPVVTGQTETEITEIIRDTVPVPSAPRRALSLEAFDAGLPEVWETLPDLPIPLEGAAGGVIGQRLYIVGGGSSATLCYDFNSKTWTNLSAARPFGGPNHSAEIINNRLYLIGGLNGAAVGKMQIYDPVTNGWAAGPSLPYSIGSCATAVIGDMIYVAAPDPSNSLRNVLARYSPSNNQWATNLPGMPQARVFAAGGTDGAHLFVFGGRAPSSANNDGSDTVQIYDPISNSWSSSADAGSWIKPLPQARSGLGRAVFRNGRFYVMGGQTTFGFGATPQQTYNRVDIYYVALNQWSLGTPMLTARHGFAAVLHEERIHVAGGGLTAGNFGSAVFEAYRP